MRLELVRPACAAKRLIMSGGVLPGWAGYIYCSLIWKVAQITLATLYHTHRWWWRSSLHLRYSSLPSGSCRTPRHRRSALHLTWTTPCKTLKWVSWWNINQYVCVSLIPRRFSANRRKNFFPPLAEWKVWHARLCLTFVSSHSLLGLVCRKSLMRNY